jgi:integral membrane sensor domain MASE1
MVIPYALVFGALRGIPFWWRLIDCSFGVFGFVPPWFCHRWVRELAAASPGTVDPLARVEEAAAKD